MIWSHLPQNTSKQAHGRVQGVKQCWRLMEAVIGVEVSTDTPDPQLMRWKGEKATKKNRTNERQEEIWLHVWSKGK